MKIILDNLRGQQIEELLREHLEHMQSTSPPESTHALDLDELRAPTITFWSIWDADSLLGCGALKQLEGNCGEIKSMRTAKKHLRRGVAARMLQHIINEAQSRGYHDLYLETGSMIEFKPARQLYYRFGFVKTEPFDTYKPDPNSVFLKLNL